MFLKNERSSFSRLCCVYKRQSIVPFVDGPRLFGCQLARRMNPQAKHLSLGLRKLLGSLFAWSESMQCAGADDRRLTPHAKDEPRHVAHSTDHACPLRARRGGNKQQLSPASISMRATHGTDSFCLQLRRNSRLAL